MKDKAANQNVEPDNDTDSFRPNWWTDKLTYLCQWKGLMKRLERLESRALEDKLGNIAITSPVWITGVARSGTTILLELMSQHPETATHCYRDFPPVLTPYLWNKFLSSAAQKHQPPRERAHHDGIVVTMDSPEAFEEPVWMAHFENLHNPNGSNVLDARTVHLDFERCYLDHIRKILLIRNQPRYLAKANYNLSRMQYLLRLFPNARFVIPVRHPIPHIASLHRQHLLFCQGETLHPAARNHLALSGHFEFGVDRVPINFDDNHETRAILNCWEHGHEIEGWARLWTSAYRYVINSLEQSPTLKDATLVIRHEDLCQAPGKEMRKILRHCNLNDDGSLP